MNLKEIRRKLIRGDLTGLFSISGNRDLLHPSEVARIFTSLPNDTAFHTWSGFPPHSQLSVFPYLDNSLQKTIVRNSTREQASTILNQLRSDDRIMFYSSLHGIELGDYLDYLNEKNKASVHDALGYPQNSVARLLNTDFATVSKEFTIAEACSHLRKSHADNETANVIYVVDEEGKLIDDIPIRRLVLNEPTNTVADIMDGFVVQLNINDTKEQAIEKFKEYDRVVLPVTNANNVLLGVITVDDVLDIVEQKDTAAIQKFGGLEQLDYPYVKTPFFSLLRKRAGWLIILFLGEMLTATAMGYFDAEISKAVVLALFIPLIISSGGNSGSQAATLIIRAMSLKELSFKNWWYVLRREIMSGLSLGIILGTIGMLRISIWQNMHWYDYGPHWMLVAATVFFSLIGIVMWGTLSGSMIPIALKRFNIDPATSSAPLVATLVDVTGLVIYFSIAAIILRGTIL